MTVLCLKEHFIAIPQHQRLCLGVVLNKVTSMSDHLPGSAKKRGWHLEGNPFSCLSFLDQQAATATLCGVG